MRHHSYLDVRAKTKTISSRACRPYHINLPLTYDNRRCLCTCADFHNNSLGVSMALALPLPHRFLAAPISMVMEATPRPYRVPTGEVCPSHKSSRRSGIAV